jgi:hypothetical protein
MFLMYTEPDGLAKQDALIGPPLMRGFAWNPPPPGPAAAQRSEPERIQRRVRRREGCRDQVSQRPWSAGEAGERNMPTRSRDQSDESRRRPSPTRPASGSTSADTPCLSRSVTPVPMRGVFIAPQTTRESCLPSTRAARRGSRRTQEPRRREGRAEGSARACSS